MKTETAQTNNTQKWVKKVRQAHPDTMHPSAKLELTSQDQKNRKQKLQRSEGDRSSCLSCFLAFAPLLTIQFNSQ
jgi:hypothetical protein